MKVIKSRENAHLNAELTELKKIGSLFVFKQTVFRLFGRLVQIEKEKEETSCLFITLQRQDGKCPQWSAHAKHSLKHEHISYCKWTRIMYLKNERRDVPWNIWVLKQEQWLQL